MSLIDKIKGEFVDIVEWLDDSRDTIVWRFPRYHNEIKMGAQLVVRESQVAVFVNEGTIADAFGPGTYTLQTQNMPILSTLKGWKYGFESPFQAEVYFVNTRLFAGLKWGTQSPIIVRDAEFGAVRLRAFGAYAVRVDDPPLFLKELVGTDPDFRTDEVEEYLRQVIVGRLTGALARAGVPVLDLAAHQEAIGARLAELLDQELATVGICVPTFIIENISLPPEVEEALDKRSAMGVIGDLQRYTQFQAADAIRDAAQNPGDGASEGIGLGLGLAVGQRMAASLTPPEVPGQEPPPLPGAQQWYVGVAGQRRGPFDLTALNAPGGGRNVDPAESGVDGWYGSLAARR